MQSYRELTREPDVCDAWRAHDVHERQAVQVVTHVVEEPFATAQQDGCDTQIHHIYQTSIEILLGGARTSSQRHVFAFAALRACSNADSMPSVTNVNVVPFKRSGSRA